MFCFKHNVCEHEQTFILLRLHSQHYFVILNRILIKNHPGECFFSSVFRSELRISVKKNILSNEHLFSPSFSVLLYNRKWQVVFFFFQILRRMNINAEKQEQRHKVESWKEMIRPSSCHCFQMSLLSSCCTEQKPNS